MPGEVDVRPSSPCLGFGVIATGGCEGVVAFFLGIHDTRGSKGFLIA